MKSERVQVRMSAAQKDAVERRAALFGCDASRYARLLVSIALDAGGELHAPEPAGPFGACLAFAAPPGMARAIDAAAERSGTARSRWLRAVLAAEAVPGSGGGAAVVVDTEAAAEELRAIRAELARVGNNVNQIALGINILAKKNWLSENDARSIFEVWARRTEEAGNALERFQCTLEDGIAMSAMARGGWAVRGAR